MTFSKILILITVCVLLSGCTMHFKATDLEVDAERQRVEDNTTYELEKIVVFEKGEPWLSQRENLSAIVEPVDAVVK